MDPTWTTSLWHLMLTIALGAGSGLIAFIGMRIAARPKLPKDLERSRMDLELGVRGVVYASVELSERVRELAILCRALPPEYKPIAEQTLRYAQLIEEATFEEGQRRGLFPRPLFTAGKAAPPPVLDDDDDEHEERREEPAAKSGRVISLPTQRREWINGQLVPASGPPAAVSGSRAG